jgi:hypothetical protein
VALLQIKEQAVNAMKNKFLLLDLVYNRNTKEDGTVRRVYETNGVAMYEVAVPQNPDSWAGGYNISDWAQGTLESIKSPPPPARLESIDSLTTLSRSKVMVRRVSLPICGRDFCPWLMWQAGSS